MLLRSPTSDYAVVPAHDLFPVPDDFPDEQAACFVINPATAIFMLRHVLAISAGEWLLPYAASGELGRMIIRLAKHDGIRTINVVRRREAVAQLQRLGALYTVLQHERVGPAHHRATGLRRGMSQHAANRSLRGESKRQKAGTLLPRPLCGEASVNGGEIVPEADDMLWAAVALTVVVRFAVLGLARNKDRA